MKIEKQQELGTNSLEEGDKYLMEINLEDMENTSGCKATVLDTGNSSCEGSEHTNVTP